jgi:hypothetical protein
VGTFCPHLEMACPHACEPPLFLDELEPTFKLYVACSLKFAKIMMLIQSANNMQGNGFTHL